MAVRLEKQALVNILKRYKEGSVELSDVMLYLKEQPYLDLGYAKIDTHRSIRQGMPEVIYGAGKTKEQILGIVKAMISEDRGNPGNTGEFPILITRMTEEAAEYLSKEPDLAYCVVSEPGGRTEEKIPPNEAALSFTYHKLSGTGVIGKLPQKDGIGRIVVATGGTSDLPVAEEAALTAEVFGNEVICLYDVGVAGLHRLLGHIDRKSVV